MSCRKLAIFVLDPREVGYSDVVAEGFKVEFSSLSSSPMAGFVK
jgi:hypothetical protein